MGAPELPNDLGEEDLRPIQHINQAAISSDDSDSDTDPFNGGYQPLSMSENIGDDGEQDMVPTMMDDDTHDALNASGHTNVPDVESADIEIERQVWNEPRPQELEIELDNTKTEQILTVMANITLPNLAIPEWASGVPEERWKEELLQRIRQRKETVSSEVEAVAATVAVEKNETQEEK